VVGMVHDDTSKLEETVEMSSVSRPLELEPAPLRVLPGGKKKLETREGPLFVSFYVHSDYTETRTSTGAQGHVELTAELGMPYLDYTVSTFLFI